MKIVVTLGGNALLRRGEAMTAQNQIENVRRACGLLKKAAAEHQLVLGHGNGPQVGLIALQNEAFAASVEAYPFDILGAESQAMVGYLFARELRNAVPGARVACLITQTLVSAEDPAFGNPTKFIGPVYSEEAARKLAKEKGWTVKADGEHFRRVVPSPKPVGIIEIETIRRLVDDGVTVISCGGGGVPVVEENGILRGVEAVVDKDFCCAGLASALRADRLIIATDVKGVSAGWRTPEERLIRAAAPSHLRAMDFAAGSMGPKVSAACDFAEQSGGTAVIGALDDIEALIDGTAGTVISTRFTEMQFA